MRVICITNFEVTLHQRFDSDKWYIEINGKPVGDDEMSKEVAEGIRHFFNYKSDFFGAISE